MNQNDLAQCVPVILLVKDEAGHVFLWYTSSALRCCNGAPYCTLSATMCIMNQNSIMQVVGLRSSRTRLTALTDCQLIHSAINFGNPSTV